MADPQGKKKSFPTQSLKDSLYPKSVTAAKAPKKEAVELEELTGSL